MWNILTRGCLREEIYIWSINEYRAHKRKSKEKKYSKSVSNREDDISTLDNADWERNISPSNGGECSYARRNCIQRYSWKMNIFIYCTPYYFSAAWLEFKTYSEHRVNYFAPPLFSKIYTVFPQFCYVQKSRSICWFKNETNIYITEFFRTLFISLFCFKSPEEFGIKIFLFRFVPFRSRGCIIIIMEIFYISLLVFSFKQRKMTVYSCGNVILLQWMKECS